MTKDQKAPLTEEQVAKRSKTNRKVLKAVGVAAVFAVGIGIGTTASGGDSTPQPAATAETVTETVEVEVPGPEVEIPVVPEECTAALDAAGIIFGDMSDFVGTTFPNAIEAAYYQDEAGIAAATEDLDTLNTRLSGSAYLGSAEACYAAAAATSN